MDVARYWANLDSGDAEASAVAAGVPDGSYQEKILTHFLVERGQYGPVGVLRWR